MLALNLENTPERLPDYALMLRRMEREAVSPEGGSALTELIANEFWRTLPTDDMLRVARAAIAAGLTDSGLTVLAAACEKDPANTDAWCERLDLLRLLGREAELSHIFSAIPLEVRTALQKETQTPKPAGFPEPENPPLAPSKDTVHLFEDELCRPFIELRGREQVLSRFMEIFQGREDAFARQWHDSEKGESGYIPVRRPLQPSDVDDHLAGRKTYGIYLLRADSSVRVGVIDIDLMPQYRGGVRDTSTREQIRREGSFLLARITELAMRLNMSPVQEFSGGKGYHLWFPFEEASPADAVRRVLLSLLQEVKGDVSCFTLEAFPKQDKLTGKGLGNLVKLPLGIHRVTGKPSYFMHAADRSRELQLEYLATVRPIATSALSAAANALNKSAPVVVLHPRHAAWTKEYPELAVLENRCSMLAQVFATVRTSRTLSVREERVLLYTLAHLPDGRRALHHLFQHLPEYNRPLLDFKISRVRGTPLGCKRIHSLLSGAGVEQPCRFEGIAGSGYAHPLLHVEGFEEGIHPKAERIENLADAIANLKTAIRQVERFLLT